MDKVIRHTNGSSEAIAALLSAYMEQGVDTFMAPFKGETKILDAIKMTEEKFGRKMILVDTPVINVDDNAAARKEAEETIKASKELGATFCFPHHTSVEQLMNKNKRAIPRLPDYLSMIRENGMIPGLSAHKRKISVYLPRNELHSGFKRKNSVYFLLLVTRLRTRHLTFYRERRFFV
jgi:hypothetical protein